MAADTAPSNRIVSKHKNRLRLQSLKLAKIVLISQSRGSCKIIKYNWAEKSREKLKDSNIAET